MSAGDPDELEVWQGDSVELERRGLGTPSVDRGESVRRLLLARDSVAVRLLRVLVEHSSATLEVLAEAMGQDSRVVFGILKTLEQHGLTICLPATNGGQWDVTPLGAACAYQEH